MSFIGNRLALWVLIAAALPAFSARAVEGGSERLAPQALAYWNLHVQMAESNQLQKGCHPTKILPRAGTEYRGLVIFFHGFTACPQQYFRLGAQLANQGYEVLIPLLPGHGKVQKLESDGKYWDDLSTLPTTKEWQAYIAAVDEMNTVAKAQPGTKVVGGLSQGGAMALLAMTSGLYDQSLPMAPFLEVSDTGFSRFFMRTVGEAKVYFGTPNANWDGITTYSFGPANKHIGWDMMGFLHGCSDNMNRAEPYRRYGYCDWTPSHINAIRYFGQYVTRKILGMHAFHGQIQIIGAGPDTAAHNGFIRQVYQHIGYYGTSGAISICLFKGANHALPSIYDGAGGPGAKPWLKTLEADTVDFVRHGNFFPHYSGTLEFGLPQCMEN